MEPPRSKTAKIATVLQRCLEVSTRVGLRSLLVVSGWFAIYAVVGFLGSTVGWIDPSYPLFSLERDPFFVIGITLVALSTGVVTSSLLLHHFLVGFEDDESQFSVLLGFVSLGFSAAVLRVTLPIAVEILLRVF
ncbi:hypothetical protein [Halopelagius fulvigenes]|uniref:Uncharacterized protein n=1 Tax=Halopelagius fulvigenes TaxID=1198324 RepID=A0ABD5TT76_9EURY